MNAPRPIVPIVPPTKDLLNAIQRGQRDGLTLREIWMALSVDRARVHAAVLLWLERKL